MHEMVALIKRNNQVYNGASPGLRRDAVAAPYLYGIDGTRFSNLTSVVTEESSGQEFQLREFQLLEFQRRDF